MQKKTIETVCHINLLLFDNIQLFNFNLNSLIYGKQFFNGTLLRN